MRHRVKALNREDEGRVVKNEPWCLAYVTGCSISKFSLHNWTRFGNLAYSMVKDENLFCLVDWFHDLGVKSDKLIL